MGASAGGWLVSLTSAKHPDLIDATLVQVPVTDIGNLHQYTSKAFNQDSEFGDTSLGNKAYYQTITPMTYIKSDVKLPATYVLGVREDLRAPVIHSRKLVEAYQSQGQNIHYYEETKGGHSSNLNNHFNAIERAYYFTFLWHYLD
jgi:prolyl oligopeptidase